MRLDLRPFMSLSSHEQPEKGLERSQIKTMVPADEFQLPAGVASVSRDELKRYAQCKRVGNYLLGRTVGEGSFAKVKEAIHILTGEKVAIKVIDKNRARKDRYVSKNMRREARLLQMIRHPHIVQLLEIVETSQCYYLVFEFADGGDLMDHICTRKKLDEGEVRKFIRQIISAVEYLHRLGIMHRDLKVENLLLDANRNIKIIDFGLSNTIFSPDPNNENHCTTQCGSPAYAAPELLVRKDYGPQIDVWSIGVNLYAMLTGRLPYTVEPFNISTLYNKMLRRQMNGIPDYISEACKDMIHKLLDPDPKERLHILEAVSHRWITMDQRDPLVLTSCPNYLCEEDLDDRILEHVEEQLQLNSDDVIRDVIQNKATKNSCVYHLLVRRLERYEREQKRHIRTPPTIQITTEKPPSSAEQKSTNHHVTTQRTNDPSSDHHFTPQKNGLVLDTRSSPKTHIIENPFKTIRVALIRQKKAVKHEEKSKQTPKAEGPMHHSSKGEPANKPKICTVKRVALVKFSPARRSLRGLASSSRNSTNSPRPGRRRGYFEGLQQRRKSPKVKRKHAEHRDSISSNHSNLSSSLSTLRQNSIDDSVNAERMRIEDQMNNNLTVSNCTKSINPRGESEFRNSDSPNAPLQNISENNIKTGDKDPTSETITYLYTDKGVVLKRDSSGENHTTNYKQEQDTVQHRVFHEKTGNTGNVEDQQESSRINGVSRKKMPGNVTSGEYHATNNKQEHDSVQHRVFHEKTGNTGDVEDQQGSSGANGVSSKKDTAGNVMSKVKVVNAKILSVPTKTVETLKATSQRASSITPTPSLTPKNQTHKEKATPLRQVEQKTVTPRRASTKLDNSKIPVLAGKTPSRQTHMSSTRLTPRTPVTPTVNTKLPGAVAQKNDVAALASKYDKCVSVIVVERSPPSGRDSSAGGNSSAKVSEGSMDDAKTSMTVGKSSFNDGKNSVADGKGLIAARKGPFHDGKNLMTAGKSSANADKGLSDGKTSMAFGRSLVNERKGTSGNAKRETVISRNTNGLNKKMVEKASVPKVSSPSSPNNVKAQKEIRTVTAKEGCVKSNLKTDGNNDIKEKKEEKQVEGKKLDQNVERIKNGIQQQKDQPGVPRRLSLVTSAKESLMNNTSKTTARRHSTNEKTGKVSTLGNAKRSSLKTQETKDAKSWSGDERRKICNYRRTNEQAKPTVKRETKTGTSVRGSAFKTSS